LRNRKKAKLVFFSHASLAFYAFQCQVRYNDDVQCAAGRIVHAIRTYALSGNASGNGEFHSLHIRRGDFTELLPFYAPEVDEIYNATQDVIPEGSVVYIASNEQNKSFFQPLRGHYDLKFLDDFAHYLNTPKATVDGNFYGMVDQLVVRGAILALSCHFLWFLIQTLFIPAQIGSSW
jgi:hypothetical protein